MSAFEIIRGWPSRRYGGETWHPTTFDSENGVLQAINECGHVRTFWKFEWEKLEKAATVKKNAV